MVLAGDGDHFCAGLDLGELTARNASEGVLHSRGWHRAFERIEFGKVPVVAVLHGAVVGGGLEIAAACHLRVAERSAYYALPEGSRGIFVGGGGSVRLTRLIGTSRIMDMMLTGRIYDAEEGQALGLSHYLVAPGAGLTKGIELAQRIAGNAPLTNFAITQVLPRIAEVRSRQRLYHRGPDRGHRPGRRRGQGAAQGFSGKARAEDSAQLTPIDDHGDPGQRASS